MLIPVHHHTISIFLHIENVNKKRHQKKNATNESLHLHLSFILKRNQQHQQQTKYHLYLFKIFYLNVIDSDQVSNLTLTHVPPNK